VNVDDLLARVADALQEDRSMLMSFDAYPAGDAAKLSADEFLAAVVTAVKEDLTGEDSQLRKSSTTLLNVNPNDLSGVVVPRETPIPRSIGDVDDDMSGGEIAAVVFGIVAVFALIGAAFMSQRKEGPKEVPNEPVSEADV